MNLFSLLVVAVVLLLPGAASAQKDDLKKQLLGKWEATLKDEKGLDFKFITEFKADDKLDIEVRGIKLSGKWKVVDDKFVATETTLPDGSVKKAKQEAKVTDDTLELKDATGQPFKLTRVK